jgi:putative FmdB family regulatory protein
MGMAAGFMLGGHSSQMDYHTRCAEGPFLTSSREMPLLLWHTAAFGTRVPGPQRHQEGSYAEAKEGYMPTYDYYCHACDRTFEIHLSIEEHDAHQVQCPQCHSTEVEQALTHFSTVTSKKS